MKYPIEFESKTKSRKENIKFRVNESLVIEQDDLVGVQFFQLDFQPIFKLTSTSTSGFVQITIES
ncbi:MAG: hypothetical protein E6R04_09535 [Spirochaetes bacterium]|nr:MAG: hypothetical protein E6R04_09535 [Spirochaetota bacterium]